MIIRRAPARKGLTLIEVLVAFTIFLLSIVAISQLMDIANDAVYEIEAQSKGTRLAESKLADYVAGIEAIGSSGGGSFEEEPEWTWTSEVTQDSVEGLYRVTVTVSRENDDTRKVSLTQYVLDPALRGGLVADTGTTTTTPSTTGGTTP